MTPPAVRCQAGTELGIKAVFAFGDGACTDDAQAAGQAAEGMVLAGGPPARSRQRDSSTRTRRSTARSQYALYFYDGTLANIEADKDAN